MTARTASGSPASPFTISCVKCVAWPTNSLSDRFLQQGR